MSVPMGRQKVEQLKIIHFGVDDGDCTLIIVRAKGAAPGTRDAWHMISILIDTGKAGRPDIVWDAVWNEILAEGGTKLDFFIISHFDYDHCRHAAGILKIVRESIGAITGDGMSGEVIPQYPWKDELRVVDRIRAGKTHETYTAREGKSREQRFHAYGWQLLFSRTMAIFTGHDLFVDAGYELPNFQMLCVAANGYVAGNGDKFEAREQKTAEDNENDYSLAFLLRFGSFRFYTGGDLHGTLEKDAKTITGGMEVPLVRGLKKSLPKNIHACAVLTHHHGSKKSTLGDFLNYFNPRIAVLSGNARASKKLPAREAIDRLTGKADLLYAPHETPSNEPSPPKRLEKKSTLLYTFNIQSSTDEGQEPATTQIARSLWNPLRRQDVILHVVDEQGRSPLEAGKQPRIYVSRRKRDLGATFAAEGVPEPYKFSEVSYQTVEGASVAYCDCDRSHETVRLPTRTQP